MPDNTVLSATTSFDGSGWASGLTILKTQYVEATAAVRAQAKLWIDADKQAAEAVASGHIALAASLKTIAAEEKATLDSLAQSQNVAGIAVDALKAQMKEAAAAARQATEAEVENTVATEELAVAHEHAVSQIQATSGALRVLEGSGGIRAAERLLTTLPGVGEALQAAFPVVGAVALAEVLFRIGEEVVHVADNFFFLKDAETEALSVGKQMAGEAEAAFAHTAQLQAQALRDQGKLVAAARVEQEALLSKPIKMPDLGDKKQLGGLSADELKEIKSVYSEVVPTGLSARIAQVNKDIARTSEELATIKKNALFSVGDTDYVDPLSLHYGSQATVELQVYGQALDYLKAKQAEFAAEVGTSGAKIGKAQQEEGRKAAEAARKQAELQKQAFEADQALTRAEVEQAKERTFEIDVAMEEGLKSWGLAFDAEESFFKAEHSALEESEHAIKEWGKTLKAVQKEASEDIARQGAVQRAAIENQGQGNLGGPEMERLEVERAHTLSLDQSPQAEQNYLAQLRAIDQEIIAEKVATQNRLIAEDKALYVAEATLNGADAASKYLTQQQEDMKKLVAIQQQGQQQIYSNTTAMLTREQQLYKNFFSAVTQDGQKLANDLILNNHKWQQDLNQILTKAALDFADYEIKRLIVHIAGTQLIQHAEAGLMAILEALHIVSASKQAATDAAAAKLSAESQILAASGVAFANTFASVSAIPVVGPAAAPEAAAAAAAAVIEGGTALVGLEVGTNFVPRTGPYQLHEGEAVVPRQYNPAAGGTGGGHTFNIGAIHVHPAAGASGRQMGKDIVGSLMDAVRRGNLVPAGVKIR